VWCCFPEQNRTRIQYSNMASGAFLPDTLQCVEKSLKGSTTTTRNHSDRVSAPRSGTASPRHCSPFPTPPRPPTCQPRSQPSPPHLLLHFQQAQDDSKSHTSHPSCNSHRNRTDQRPATITCADLASLGLSIPSNHRAPDTLSSPAVAIGRGAWRSA
jgi:hypothetical protein